MSYSEEENEFRRMKRLYGIPSTYRDRITTISENDLIRLERYGGYRTISKSYPKSVIEAYLFDYERELKDIIIKSIEDKEDKKTSKWRVDYYYFEQRRTYVNERFKALNIDATGIIDFISEKCNKDTIDRLVRLLRDNIITVDDVPKIKAIQSKLTDLGEAERQNLDIKDYLLGKEKLKNEDSLTSKKSGISRTIPKDLQAILNTLHIESIQKGKQLKKPESKPYEGYYFTVGMLRMLFKVWDSSNGLIYWTSLTPRALTLIQGLTVTEIQNAIARLDTQAIQDRFMDIDCIVGNLEETVQAECNFIVDRDSVEICTPRNSYRVDMLELGKLKSADRKKFYNLISYYCTKKKESDIECKVRKVDESSYIEEYAKKNGWNGITPVEDFVQERIPSSLINIYGTLENACKNLIN